jgi:hypothetical protein
MEVGQVSNWDCIAKGKKKKKQRSDQRPDSRRSKDKSRGTRTSPRHNVRGSKYIIKRDCSDD